LIRPPNAIVNQIIGHFQGEQFVNADGFGITWYTDTRSKFNPLKDERSQGDKQGPIRIQDGPLVPFVRGPRPAIYKTTIAKPLNDPSFISLCANVASKCIFAHRRAAMAPPVATTNNHPFVFGRHSFMHNGDISDFGDIRGEMLTYVAERITAMIEGGTDTEHLAAIYMTELCGKLADFHTAGKHYPAASMWKALKSAIQIVEGIQKGRGKVPNNFLNISATDGESLLAICYGSDTSTPPIELWVSVDVADTLNRKPYAHTHGHIFEDARAEDDIDEISRDLRQNAKRVVQRDPENKVIGIEPELQDILAKEHAEQPFPSRHGPHIVVSSEPTTIDPRWFKLSNRDVIMVDSVWPEGGVQRINLSAETL